MTKSEKIDEHVYRWIAGFAASEHEHVDDTNKNPACLLGGKLQWKPSGSRNEYDEWVPNGGHYICCTCGNKHRCTTAGVTTKKDGTKVFHATVNVKRKYEEKLAQLQAAE